MNENENKDAKNAKMYNAKCFCCKEKGHDAESCPRDPNIKTLQDMSEEEERLAISHFVRKVLIFVHQYFLAII